MVIYSSSNNQPSIQSLIHLDRPSIEILMRPWYQDIFGWKELNCTGDQWNNVRRLCDDFNRFRRPFVSQDMMMRFMWDLKDKYQWILPEIKDGLYYFQFALVGSYDKYNLVFSRTDSLIVFQILPKDAFKPINHEFESIEDSEYIKIKNIIDNVPSLTGLIERYFDVFNCLPTSLNYEYAIKRIDVEQ